MNDLINLYQERLNLQNATFQRVDHDDAMVAVVFKITQPNSEEYILKICDRISDYLREVYFLNYFANILPVPRVIQLVPPETNVHGAVLMECLPGTLLKKEDLNDQLSYQMGSLLAHIHLNRTEGYGDLTQPQTISRDPRHHFTLKFQEGMLECSPHLPKSMLENCQRYYDTHVSQMDAADGPCMIHRDFRPGNLLVSDGKLQGIIDWSSGRASFAEEDFCFLENRDWPNEPNITNLFLAGYASIRPLPDYRVLMPLMRLSHAIAVIGFTVKRGTWDTLHSRVYKFNRRFLENFF